MSDSSRTKVKSSAFPVDVEAVLKHCEGYIPPKSFDVDGESVKGHVSCCHGLDTLHHMAELLKEFRNLS